MRGCIVIMSIARVCEYALVRVHVAHALGMFLSFVS